MSFLDKLKGGLERTRKGMIGRIQAALPNHQAIGAELYEEIEESLLLADVGAETTLFLLEQVKNEVSRLRLKDPLAVLPLLKEKIATDLLGDRVAPLAFARDGLTVVLLVGVNGAGKTTTIGKLAERLRNEGRKVLLAAGDTFRAAAGEQLAEWGRRAEVEMVGGGVGADAAAVVYDSLQAAKSRRADVLLVDTAGRLQNKANLLEELKKIVRIIQREVPGAPHEVLLVLDATTGQNGLQQAKVFGEAVGVTGIVLSKLDGSAKGGVVLGIKRTFGVPVKLLGVGEKVADLKEFDPLEFVEALFS